MHQLESAMQETVVRDGLLFLQPGCASNILKEGGIFIIDFDRFKESPETCNSLLQERTYNGEKISDKVKIIGLVSEEALDKDLYSEAFLSRWDEKIDPPPTLAKPLDLQRASDLEQTIYPVVEFHSNPDFASILLGTVIRTSHWQVLPGPLLQKRKGLILKNAPWDSVDFQVFLQELLITRQVSFNGEKISIPDDFTLLSYDGYTDSERRSLKTKILKNVNADPIIINKENFSTLFEQDRISQNTIEHVPGLLFQQNTPQWVHVAEELTTDQWMRLVMAGPACKISAAQNISVPDDFKKVVCIEELETQSCVRTYSSDVAFTSKELRDTHPTMAFIDVGPQTTYETLCFKVTPQKKTDSAQQGIDLQFLVEDGPLLVALKNNQPICIRGLEDNPVLEKRLASLLHRSPYLFVNAQKVPCDQPVHLLFSKKQPGCTDVHYTIDDYLKDIPDDVRTTWRSFLLTVHAREPLSYLQVKSFIESVQNSDGLEKYPFLFKCKRDPELYADLKKQLRAHSGMGKREVKKKDKIARYSRVLDKHPALFLQGNSGTGKSYLLKQLVAKMPPECSFGPVTVGSLTTENDLWQACFTTDTGSVSFEQKEIFKWVASSHAGPKLLLIDEANLTNDGFWTIFRGLFSETPFIQIAGQILYVTKEHKVIFTGNPESYEGRIPHDILNKDFFTIHFPDFDDDFLIEKIILPLLASPEDATYILRIQRQLKQLQPHRVFSPRDLEEVCERALCLGYPHSHDAIRKALYSVYQGDLSERERKQFLKRLGLQMPWPHFEMQFLEDTDLHLTSSVKDLANAVLFALKMRDRQRDECKGKRAMIIKGPAGRGKDTLLEKALQKTKTPYYHITAENIKNLSTTIKKAKEEGAVLVISELNLFSSQIVEGLLNDAITGDATLGFFVFVTMNDDLQKRNEFSPAFINRCIVETIPEYTFDELREILRKSISASDTELLLSFHQALIGECTNKSTTLRPTARDLFKAAKAQPITPSSIEKSYQTYLWRLKKNYHTLKYLAQKQVVQTVRRSRPLKSTLDDAPAEMSSPERYKVIGTSTHPISDFVTRRYRIDEEGQVCPLEDKPSFEKQGKCINTVILNISASIRCDGVLLLPVQTNTMPQNICIIDAGNKSTHTAQQHSDGTWFIPLPKQLSQDARITYSLMECKECAPTQQSRLCALNLDEWKELQNLVQSLSGQSVHDTVAALCTFVKTNATYSLSKETRDALKDIPNATLGTTWFERFLTVRAGGCAECARFLCTLLQDLGITARIATGPFAGNTRIESAFHAVVEYYDPDGGWKSCDPVAITADVRTKEYVQQTDPDLHSDEVQSLTNALLSITGAGVRDLTQPTQKMPIVSDREQRKYFKTRFAELECSYFRDIHDYESCAAQHGMINISRAIKGNPNFFDAYQSKVSKEKKTVVFSKEIDPELFEFFRIMDFKIAMLCKNGLIYTATYDEFSAHTSELVDLDLLKEIKQKAKEHGVTGNRYKFFDCEDYFTLQLTSLKAGECPQRTKIRHQWLDRIKNLKLIKKLKLSGWNVSTTEPFANLTQLEELDLSYTPITSLNGIERLTNLKRLKITHCNNLNIEELASLTQLEELDLSDTGITSLKGIERLTNLKRVKLSGCHGFKNIEELASLTQLEELDLSCTSITSLKGIERLTNLKKLKLTYCHHLYSIEELTSLTQLEELDLSCTQISSLNGIKKVPNLKRLKLTYCHKLRNIEELASLTQLEELDLSNTPITSLKGIERVPNLKKLKCIDCHFLNNIEELANLMQLEELDLSGTPITSLKGIERLTNLKRLKITRSNINNLEELGNLTQLEELDLSGTSITSLKGIERLTNLKILKIIYCYILNNLEEFANLTRLEELDLSHALINSLQGIERLKNLKILKLYFCTKLNSIEELASLMQLEELDLSGIPITSLQRLGRLKNLKRLNLSFCDNLNNLEELANLTQLEKLDFNCTPITSLQGIERLKKLKKIGLDGCRQLKNIKELANLTQLEELNVNSTSITRAEIEQLRIHIPLIQF